MNDLTRDNTCIGDGRRGFGPVYPGDKSSLVAEVFHLCVEYHMAGNFLIAIRRRLPVKEEFESNTNIFHFLGNCVSPEGIAILFVKLKSVCDGLRHLDAKLWVCFRYQGLLFSTSKMIRSLFLRIWGTHQLKAGSWSMPRILAYSATSIR